MTSEIKSSFHTLRYTVLLSLVLFSTIPSFFNVNTTTIGYDNVLEDRVISVLERPPYSGNNTFSTSPPSFQVNNQSSTNPDPISFDISQISQFPWRTNQAKQITSPPNANLSLESEIISSTYRIASNAEEQSQDWVNGYGPIYPTMIPTMNGTAFRLNFTDNNQSSAGVQNIRFNMSNVPSPAKFPTLISFDYRIPFVNQILQDSRPTLGLEFEFVNNTSITFYLSKGGNLPGDPIDENISRPVGTDPALLLRNASSSLYILYNGSLPLTWQHISINISWMINTCFSQNNFTLFSELKAVKLSLFLFTLVTPQFTLDIDNLEYNTEKLPLDGSLRYFINSTEVLSTNGSLNTTLLPGNFTFFAQDDSPWNRSLEYYLNVTITRIQRRTAFSTGSYLNSSHVKIYLSMSIPNISENLTKSITSIFLPTDWTDLRILNSSTQLLFINVTKPLNMYLMGKQFRIEGQNLDQTVLEALGPNYFTRIIAPTDLNKDETLRVKGDLLFPLAGDLYLYLLSNSFLYNQSTLPMINGSFSFPDIIITEAFPLGILRLVLNWTSNWEYGFYEQFIIIYESSESATIVLHSQQNMTLYQYEPLFINLSLFLDSTKYAVNTTLVFLIKGNASLFFSQTPNGNFVLNITHLMWSPGNVSVEILASDTDIFFAKQRINLEIISSTIVWSFENLYDSISKYNPVTFRLYSYLQPTEGGGTFQPLPGLIIKVWINSSMEFENLTNLAGYTDIYFNLSPNLTENRLYIGMGGFLEEQLVKFQTITFTILNATTQINKTRADIYELSRSPIGSNGSFFVYYGIEYSVNDSSWYTPLSSYGLNIKTAFIVRDYYVIGVNNENGVLSWNLEGNTSSTDILVLELPSPTVYISQVEISEKFRFKIRLNSAITVNNFSINLDLSFLGFLPLNLSLLDSLGRNITSTFPVTVEGTQISIPQLNIIGGLSIYYLLEGYFADLNIKVSRPFQESYNYNDTIKGSWRFYSPLNFSYTVIYTLGHYSLICFNTSYKTFSNKSTLVEAQLPSQYWNSTLSIRLEVKFSSIFSITSRVQTFAILDPYMPVLNYSLEVSGEIIRINTFVFEPEHAAGVKNISVLDMDMVIATTNFLRNYHIFSIPLSSLDSGNIILKVMDWAGNNNTMVVTGSLKDMLNSNPSSFLWDLEFFTPTIISMLILAGFFFTKVIKKRRMSFLQS